MRCFRAYSVGIMQSSTAGAAMDLDVFQVEYRTVFDAAVGECNFSIPIPILGVSQVEGVDSPFYSHFYTATDPSPFLHRASRSKALKSLVAGSYGLGMPIPVADATPDTTPVTVGKVLDIPIVSFAKRKKQAWLLAGSATVSAPGYSPEFTPAASYNDYSCRLLSEIQRHMLESTIDGGVTWSLWTQEEVLAYMNERLVRFIMETGLLRERTLLPVTSGTAEVPLPNDLVEVRRVALTGGGVLTKIDTFALDHGTTGWEVVSGTPYAYVEEPLQTLTIQLVNTPSASGTVDVLYVKAPAEIVAGCWILPIPSIMTPYIKYGIMADMFMKQGEANSPERAEYCEGRFAEGIELAKMFIGATK